MQNIPHAEYSGADSMPEPILNWQFSNIESWGKLN
jgi:hypothetical protein